MRPIATREMSEWMALDAIEGEPTRRLELAVANLAAVTYAMWRSKKDPKRPLGDFVLDHDTGLGEPGPVDDGGEQLMDRVRDLNRQLGGRDLTRGGDGP